MLGNLSEYSGLYNLLMVAYLFVKEAGFEWWYISFPVGFAVFCLFDYLYIWPNEINVIFGSSKDLQEVNEKLDKLLEYSNEV